MLRLSKCALQSNYYKRWLIAAFNNNFWHVI